MPRSIRNFNIPSPPPRSNPELLKVGSFKFPPGFRGKKAVQMPHQLVLKYLSSKTNFVFNQTLFTLFRAEICHDDTFKLLLKTLLKELFTNKGEILSCKFTKPCKNRKTNHESITSEKEINLVQIPHPSKATFKFPPTQAKCTVKCPGMPRGGGF